jgi:TPR repeat protein
MKTNLFAALSKSVLLSAMIWMPSAALAAGSTTTNVDPLRFGQRSADEAFGAFQRGMYKTALTLALERAKEGDAAAQTLAAEIYARGLGIAQNLNEAARLYKLAAEKDIPEAQFQTALFLIDGKRPLPPDTLLLHSIWLNYN